MRSAQPVSVISLILHCVSASKGHLQASSIKYIKGIMYSCINPYPANVENMVSF